MVPQSCKRSREWVGESLRGCSALEEEHFLRLRMMMVVVVVVMMTLKMILGNGCWVSEKEEDNKALSVVEYSHNRPKKKALVKTLKRHERHVPSCWCGVRTSSIQSTPHSRLVSPAGETIRALRKSDSEYKGGGIRRRWSKESKTKFSVLHKGNRAWHQEKICRQRKSEGLS